MDTIPITARWPKHPYRGLDFYRETDALLFCEREMDVRECADIILGFGVKILLLQGSSGSGKSSFLRAGLIPHLKREARQNFFLNDTDAVIRCTIDPLPEIARSLIGALDNRRIFTESAEAIEWDGETLIETALSREVSDDLQRAMAASRERLAEAVVDALVKVCGNLPGKLVLVLDQAEEVLTRTPGEGAGDEAAAAFFHFLEDIYLRNVDARLVVALRTEYYGRFRDELRISDDRLGKRPRSGGIDSYLLRPLREKSTLLRVIEAPTLACDDAGALVYDFAFERGLIEKIVDDLVEEFPHAAITPALQVVCASLYERLTQKNRTIACGDYDTLKCIRGIVRSYVERGIRAAKPRTKAEIDQWHLLLHSLVSRQGGGTVVSLTEPLEELTRRAQNLGIVGDIEAALVKLTSGPAPLLRGEPADGPRFLSLKHDVLAVVLSRWFHEHSARLKAKKEEALKRRLMFSIGVPVILAIVLGAAFFGYDRGQEALKEKIRAVQITNRHAIRAPTGDFRSSLLLTLANLDATAQPSGTYEWITGGNDSVGAEALTALREVLPRTPWFAGRFGAAGLDPVKDGVALLQRDQRALLTLSFPSDDGERADPNLKRYDLPTRAARQSMLRPAAGFVNGLGPVALVDGYAYFWSNGGDPQECDLEASLPQSIASGSWIRAEFIAGKLQLSTVERHGRMSNLLILRLVASDLRTCSNPIAAAQLLRVPERTSSQPIPVFADAPDAPHLFEYLEETGERPPNELAANLPSDPSPGQTGKLAELDAVVSSADHQSVPMRIAVGQVAPERGVPERLHYTLAFAVNAQATVFKFDGPDFYVYDLANSRPGNRPNHVVVPPQHVGVATDLPDNNTWRLRPGRLPWLYPPLAAARVAQHWRVAWLAESGVWAVESSDLDPGTARPILDAPLIGEPDGMKLQFTPDGEFLVLTATQGPRAPISLRIWDLRPSWRTWIKAPTTTEQELRRVACRIVRADGLGGAIDDTELDLFQIDRKYREPCPETKGANE